MKHKIKLIQTPIMKHYIVKLMIRVAIFLTVLYGYLFRKEELWDLLHQPIRMGITSLHVLWAFFMAMMIHHIFPYAKDISMALGKKKKEKYVPEASYSHTELLQYVQDQNIKAWTVMLVWLIFNGIFGLLYVLNIISEVDLLMLTVFYFLSDYICILFFCPFQTYIMGNRCCVNCRIYDWGHFMMFTPMLFIKNFFSWSLFFTACIVLICWEISYARHPERFWSGSNSNLQCANCKDKTCQIKNSLLRH